MNNITSLIMYVNIIIPFTEIFCTTSSYLYYYVLGVKYIKRTQTTHIDIEK